ncbi:MAG TPA: amidohydrolase, partial [Gammaproteobacteria bacterium]|nr:amidohydrolase [Gammaproteobacteria bacterium]
APNIVPAHTSARYIIRGETVKDMEELRVKVRHCFEAGALATGSKLEIKGGDKPYTEMHHDAAMAEIYRRNAESLGRSFDIPAKARAFITPETAARFSASTDMGNVSLALPSIHPMIGIDSLPAVNHQPEFTAHCVSPAADQALWDGALAMAWTVIDMAADLNLRKRLLARH